MMRRFAMSYHPAGSVWRFPVALFISALVTVLMISLLQFGGRTVSRPADSALVWMQAFQVEPPLAPTPEMHWMPAASQKGLSLGRRGGAEGKVTARAGHPTRVGSDSASFATEPLGNLPTPQPSTSADSIAVPLNLSLPRAFMPTHTAGLAERARLELVQGATTKTERLAEGVSSSAKLDCLAPKPESASPILMGLILVYKAARDKCAGQ